MTGASGGLEALETLAEAPAYAAWIHARVAPHLLRRVLEIGAGTGTITTRLQAERVVALERDPAHLSLLRRRCAERPAVRVVGGDALRREDLEPLRDERLDTLFASHVLEHLPDDVAALRAIREALPSLRRVVLVVPALEALRAPFDDVVGHHRRYDRRSLERALRGAGATDVGCSYMNLPGIFGWLLHMRLLRRRALPTGSVALFDRLAPLFSTLERRIAPPPLGLAVVGWGDWRD